MATDYKPRLFDHDREPLGLLPESMKTANELDDPNGIANMPTDATAASRR